MNFYLCTYNKAHVSICGSIHVYRYTWARLTESVLWIWVWELPWSNRKNICIFCVLYTKIKSHNFFTKCIFIRHILCWGRIIHVCIEDTQIQQIPRTLVLLWYSIHALLSNFHYFVEPGNKYSEKFFPLWYCIKQDRKIKEKNFLKNHNCIILFGALEYYSIKGTKVGSMPKPPQQGELQAKNLQLKSKSTKVEIMERPYLDLHSKPKIYPNHSQHQWIAF